jgi:hypothetical protein
MFLCVCVCVSVSVRVTVFPSQILTYTLGNSFGWEVKPGGPCRKILRHVKYPLLKIRY